MLLDLCYPLMLLLRYIALVVALFRYLWVSLLVYGFRELAPNHFFFASFSVLTPIMTSVRYAFENQYI